MSGPVGTVCLLHFSEPYRHAKHYTGWTTDLPTRLARHAAGLGARLTDVVAAAGITWTVARTWPNATRARERALKDQGGASRRCPLCGPHPRLNPAGPIPGYAPLIWHFQPRPEDGLITARATCTDCGELRAPLDFDLAHPELTLCWDCQDDQVGEIDQVPF